MLRLLRSIFFCLFLTVCLPAEAGQSYISLSPEATEILFALGLGDQIIGNTSFCDYPEAAKKILKVGTFSEPNIEKIISLRPEIIFATGLEQAPVVRRLQGLGLKVFVSNPKTIDELFSSITSIGELTDRKKEAAGLVAQLREKIDRVKSKVARIPINKRPRVFIEIWYDPIMTAGPNSFVGQLIGLAGGINIAYDAPRAYSRFSPEVVIRRNPDVIILGYMAKENNKDLLSERLGWSKINAVKNKRVVSDISPDLMLRAGPRIARGLEELFKRLYPDNAKN